MSFQNYIKQFFMEIKNRFFRNGFLKKYMVAVKEILDYPLTQKLSFPNKLLYKNTSSPNSFQDVMKFPLTLMQIFGFFPLGGIRQQCYRNLRFKWISWKVFYSLFSLFGFVVNFFLYCKDRRIANIIETNAILFQLEFIVIAILCIHLAVKWPKFAKEWYLIETAMKGYEPLINLKRKIIIICVGMLSIAVLEHGMVTCNRILLCIKSHPKSIYDAIHDYFVNRTFRELFHYVSYYVVLGLIFQFFIFQKTFMWTFLDVFIIVVSRCFTFRLQQISKKLSYMSKIEVTDKNVWRMIREDYVKLSKLCILINKHFCWFIIISFLTNIYHILAQLFSSLRPIENTFEKVYFYVSFFLLISRVTLVCIFGGAVYDQHGEIVKALTSVPSCVYNIEVERFITHVSTCEMVLTGKHFFKITRNLILKVTSAIVTYELVLIQFNTQDFKNKEL
nr:gustatory receptor 2 [Pachyrhinus yasumatsui]